MTDKLASVHPALVVKIKAVLSAMEMLGHPMTVTDGVRTTERQAALFAQGRTAPGHIVTYADGVTKRSNHQPHADGYGRAVDCCFLVNGTPNWDEARPWALYGAAVEAVGLRWGGSWTGKKRDRPHVEMP